MKCLVVVAHPDDEVIWIGGTILRHRSWEWQILSLCRADDPDREPRFHSAADALGAAAFISDLDDSPILAPLSPDLHEITGRISLLVPSEFNLIFTHGASGEYTRHERHEQVHRAVKHMVAAGKLRGELLSFAYEDCGGKHDPRPDEGADIRVALCAEQFADKQHLVRDIYGFGEGSFEFRSAGPVESLRLEREAADNEYIQRLLGKR